MSQSHHSEQHSAGLAEPLELAKRDPRGLTLEEGQAVDQADRRASWERRISQPERMLAATELVVKWGAGVPAIGFVELAFVALVLPVPLDLTTLMLLGAGSIALTVFYAGITVGAQLERWYERVRRDAREAGVELPERKMWGQKPIQ